MKLYLKENDSTFSIGVHHKSCTVTCSCSVTFWLAIKIRNLRYVVLIDFYMTIAEDTKHRLCYFYLTYFYQNLVKTWYPVFGNAYIIRNAHNNTKNNIYMHLGQSISFTSMFSDIWFHIFLN